MKLKKKFQEWHNEVASPTIEEDVNVLVSIAEKFTIDFTKWVRTNAYDTGEKWYYQEDNETYTTEELLEIYKKQLD